MRNVSFQLFLILLLLCLGQAGWYYPQLPDRIASHFGASGMPDGWSSKASFLAVYLVTVGLTAVLLGLIGLLLVRIPDKWINLPNKDYWLAPERRAETFGFLSGRFLWFGSATLLLMIDTFHQVFRVNTGKAAGLEHPWLSLVLYLLFTVFWTVGLIRRFLRKP